MKKVTFCRKVMLIIALTFGLTSLTMSQPNAWINEFHYDNSGIDAGEFVEVVIENAGTYSLSDFLLILYNGTGGVWYNQKTMNLFTVGTTYGDFTFYSYTYPVDGIQNGAPDGFALVYQGTVIPGQFLSYEGFFTATNLNASGMTSVDIGVSESGATPIGSSLRLAGTGSQYPQFTWQPAAPHSKGLINPGQTFPLPDPEPTNYPTNFTATTYGTSIMVNWTDAVAGVGEQLPASYLLIISDQPGITSPVDFTPVANDGDMSDGIGAVNVNYGIQAGLFNMLQPETQYYFEIFPYTNGGSKIDYKTDGVPPTATATTQAIVNANNFEGGNFGSWTPYNSASNKNWGVVKPGGALGTTWLALMNGYQEDVPSNDWLISPQLNLNYYRDAMITFYTSWQFSAVTDELKLFYSKNYTGGDPMQATWTEVLFNKSAVQNTWAFSGPLALPDFNTGNVHLAFRYQSSGVPRLWRVDEIMITGTPADPIPLSTWSVIIAMSLILVSSLFFIRRRF